MILRNLSPSRVFLKMGHDVIFSNSRFTAVFFIRNLWNVFYWLDMMVVTTYNDFGEP